MLQALDELRKLAAVIRSCLEDSADDTRATASLSSEYRATLRRIRAWESSEETEIRPMSRSQVRNEPRFLAFLEDVIQTLDGDDRTVFLDWLVAQGEED